MGSTFRETDQPPTRSALLTANWRGWHATGKRLDRIAAGKQPASRQQHPQAPALPPPGAQQLKQLRRQHGVAVLAAFALLDSQHHTLGIDVADLDATTTETRSPAP
jgi:hypothetical protein